MIEFHEILYMHSYWQDLAWDCYTSFFSNLYQSYGPLYRQNLVSVQYSENKLTEIHQIIYMHSRLELLPVIFCLFVTMSWPLFDVRI